MSALLERPAQEGTAAEQAFLTQTQLLQRCRCLRDAGTISPPEEVTFVPDEAAPLVDLLSLNDSQLNALMLYLVRNTDLAAEAGSCTAEREYEQVLQEIRSGASIPRKINLLKEIWDLEIRGLRGNFEPLSDKDIHSSGCPVGKDAARSAPSTNYSDSR